MSNLFSPKTEISTMILRTFLTLVCLFGMICSIIPVYGEEIELGTVGSYLQDRDPALDSSLTPGLFPTIVVTGTPEPQLTLAPPSTDLWVILSAVPAVKTGSGDMLIGYVGGRNTGVSVILSGRNFMDEPFMELGSVTADENGIFVWPIPEGVKMSRYSATATGPAGSAVSSAVTFFSDDADVPSSQGTTLVPTQQQAIQEKQSTSSLTLSASTTSPKVGDDVQLYGRLSDASGKGISGASVIIEEDDGTGYLDIITVRTDGNGDYEGSIKTVYAFSVPVRARFAGNDEYLPSKSNSILFRASE